MGPNDAFPGRDRGDLPLVSLLGAGLGVGASCSIFRSPVAVNDTDPWVDEETSPPSGWRGLVPAAAESQSGAWP